MSLNVDDLIQIFNDLFLTQENTCLVRGDDEPIYLPADDNCSCSRIIFAHGYFASALHEISHWCIAGVERRKLIDFGYWYNPDGRSATEQKLFESVEIKPQALEWIFSEACGLKFHISVDNLKGESSGSEVQFKRNVCEQAQRYMQVGLPARAQKFTDALLSFYDRRHCLNSQLFLAEKL